MSGVSPTDDRRSASSPSPRARSDRTRPRPAGSELPRFDPDAPDGGAEPWPPSFWSETGAPDRLAGLWDRLAALRQDPRAVGVVVAVVVLALGVHWYRSSAAAPVSPATVAPTATTDPARAARPDANDPTAVTAVTAAPGVVLVHVAGAVERPGVVELSAGARVVDAIDAAGGPLARADLDRLNLAAVLADGERIFVARVGDPPGTGVVAGSGTGPTGTASPVGPLDLNAATAEQLEELPGIGPMLATAIVAERDRRGGFTSVDDLRSVRGIGEGRFADLRGLVTV